MDSFNLLKSKSLLKEKVVTKGTKYKLYLRVLEITPTVLFCNVSSQVSLPELWAFCPKHHIIFIVEGLPPPPPLSLYAYAQPY